MTVTQHSEAKRTIIAKTIDDGELASLMTMQELCYLGYLRMEVFGPQRQAMRLIARRIALKLYRNTKLRRG